MNEKITLGNEMLTAENDIKKIISVIAENTLKTRPKRDVQYTPFKPISGVKFAKSLANEVVDLNKIYPNADEGDWAYVEFNIETSVDYEILININGNVVLYFENEKIFSCTDSVPDREADFTWGHFNVPVTVHKNSKNNVKIKCTKHNGEFGCSFILSIHRYPGMWANDYIYACRMTSPIEEFSVENGVAISKLYKDDDKPQKTEYNYPQPIKTGNFDFNKLYGRGDSAYVYTVAKQSHVLKLDGTIGKIIINGELSDNGVKVEKDDDILIRVDNTAQGWYLRTEGEALYLPFINSKRRHGTCAMCLGPFFGKKLHAPEFEIRFEKVYRNERGEKVYWKFCDGSQLQAVLDSVFYGQWFYALMVGFYGIRRAGQALGLGEYEELFCDNMDFLQKYFDYITYDAECNGMPTFMPRAIAIEDLDNIGTMGMNLIDAYFDNNNEKLIPLIKRLKGYLKRIPTFPDGTFNRKKTMWADDVFMSCPFMARLGIFEDDEYWFKEVLKQIKGFYKRLYIKEKNIFSHIFFVEENQANRIPWGRGNGWIMWALTEVMLRVKNKEIFEELLDIYVNFAKGIKALQSPTGLWRQVLDSDDDRSYPETSCTAMFMLGLIRGIKNGWIDESYIKNVEAAWKGLLKYSIDKDGNIYGVCMGSGCAMDPKYYYDIPTIKNDDHGTGIILAAAVEYYEFIKELQ